MPVKAIEAKAANGEVYFDFEHWDGRHYKHDDYELVARWYGDKFGYRSKAGGWIYNKHDRPVLQGWHSFYLNYIDKIRDAVTTHLTAFGSFRELIDAPGTYRPTLIFRDKRGDYLYRFLATEYNKAQAARHDSRRAHTLAVETS